MGGQVEDEEAEAEHSHEIQEGRLENTARREIVDAIQHMGKVEIGLAAINTSAALPPARAAVEALQRAFGRNRYILRTLPVRSRVDPSRRLTGEMSAASDWRRELFPPAPDAAGRGRTRAVDATARSGAGRQVGIGRTVRADGARGGGAGRRSCRRGLAGGLEGAAAAPRRTWNGGRAIGSYSIRSSPAWLAVAERASMAHSTARAKPRA